MYTSPALTDLIFPSASISTDAIIEELQRNQLSISNRLHSIAQDASFVHKVAAQLKLPLIANERCGSWYINPEHKAGSAYFKSTDGHFGIWSFSLRRLNTHLLELIARGHGCIIVDSTRRGKSMPDALSKSIPIWIAVLNRLLFPNHPETHVLVTPEKVVSRSEHSQIEIRIPGFVQSATDLSLNVDALRIAVKKPIRPIWITPSAVIKDIDKDDTTWPMVLCTASSRESLDHINDKSYVQGAADDHESWAHGLTAVTFWQHKDILLSTPEDELIQVIGDIALEQIPRYTRDRTLVLPTTQLYLSDNDSILENTNGIDLVISCSKEADADLETRLRQRGTHYIHLSCSSGKIGSRQLRGELIKLDDMKVEMNSKVLCACDSGRDLAVGVALVLLCKLHTDDGDRLEDDQSGTSNKLLIKQRLSWIMVSMADASPSRATLQSVNAYLMS